MLEAYCKLKTKPKTCQTRGSVSGHLGNLPQGPINKAVKTSHIKVTEGLC